MFPRHSAQRGLQSFATQVFPGAASDLHPWRSSVWFPLLLQQTEKKRSRFKLRSFATSMVPFGGDTRYKEVKKFTFGNV